MNKRNKTDRRVATEKKQLVVEGQGGRWRMTETGGGGGLTAMRSQFKSG